MTSEREKLIIYTVDITQYSRSANSGFRKSIMVLCVFIKNKNEIASVKAICRK